ncbi:MAG: transketolase [candidate division Zixibacteria bacterium CG_4_9_14_3_um_filter_46_8]|nr:MAG: transketolase [candidate division Zixibacteria bacterium CG_4_9_14_3_um_filter_46_8]
MDNLSEHNFGQLIPHFAFWEKIKDLADQYIDIMVNYRQSGHPGGSRSKVHALVATLLSGVMRWDIRNPEKEFGDRLILVGGHCTPLIYSVLAVLNDAMRIKYRQAGNLKYLINKAERRALYPEGLISFRQRNGLSGHAEMVDKSLILKFNTGPSGHGSPAAAGAATALKLAGAEEVKVFAFEGEAGHTTGATHETKNTAWGLGLSNLYYLLDWNDFGIDDHPVSSVVHGSPRDWFEPYGWRVFASEHGSDWTSLTRMLCDMIYTPNPNHVPSCGYFRTRKGRGYGIYDNKSHGTPHQMNCEAFWEIRREFARKYGMQFEGQDRPAPESKEEIRRQFINNLEKVSDVLKEDQCLVDYITDTLVELGDSVPKSIPGFRLHINKNPIHDEALCDFRNYPAEIYAKPGERKPNRAALASWGAWVNSFCATKYSRPLFIVMAADLADSTNISGFAQPFGDFKGYGWYNRHTNLEGVLLPQEITEMANAGLCVGIASVNFHTDPENDFNGFYTACSTYGSFSYLKYGLMRLFSQLAQDCPLKVGKVLWIAGHSGPETAEDSRTHFGIFEPGVTQLFPQGTIINLHPWEHNEVPVLLGEALSKMQPIIVLHLTRPAMIIPDRAALGIPSHFEAARGAYILRDFDPNVQKMGTVIVSGASSTDNTVSILPELAQARLNVKIIAAPSRDLFIMQPELYQNRILPFDDWMDSMTITNGARRLMHDWICNKICEEYSLSSDWDDRWRGGGSVESVLEDAHLSPDWILRGIERFVIERKIRLAKLRI